MVAGYLAQLMFAVSLLFAGPAYAQPLGPGFDCARASDGLTVTICGSQELRRLDLELLQPYYALRHAQPQRLGEFRQQASDFVASVNRSCGLPQRGAVELDRLDAARRCITAAYREQRSVWLLELRRVGPQVAIEEAERPLGQHVALQEQLSIRGYLQLPIDGIYGTATRAAVQSLQRDRGMAADGFIGLATARLLVGTATSQQRVAQGGQPGALPSGSQPSPGLAAAALRWVERLRFAIANMNEWVIAALALAVSWASKFTLLHLSKHASSGSRRLLFALLGYGLGFPAVVAGLTFSAVAYVVRAATAGSETAVTTSSANSRGSDQLVSRLGCENAGQPHPRQGWVSIQYREALLWVTVMLVDNDYSFHLDEVKRMHPNRRVRAIDEAGRVIDIA